MAELQIHRSSPVSPAHAAFSLSSTLTVQHTAELRLAILEAFEECAHVSIDLTGVTDIDVAGLQLLCAAHSFAVTRGRTLSLEIPASGAVAQKGGEAGFVRHTGCSVHDKDACPWIGGDDV